MREPQETSRQPQVALVLFCVGPYRAAIEACHVLAMTDQPAALHTTNAHSLLYESSAPQPSPSGWLTLSHAQTGHEQTTTWQLGVSGDITLQKLPANTLYPLPKLLLSRRFSAALCGFTFEQQQLVLLLDGRKLMPPPSPSLTRQP